MKAALSGLSQGNHAIHIHAIGDCSAADGKSAGGHWNPTNKNHGKWMEAPFHIGDIGNLVVGADGTGTIERETNLWSVGGKDAAKNVVGHAIIIHEGPDDFSSQPSGAAGPRVGCGEIVRK
jgi:Cu-Zn family superoxide dismutase